MREERLGGEKLRDSLTGPRLVRGKPKSVRGKPKVSAATQKGRRRGQKGEKASLKVKQGMKIHDQIDGVCVVMCDTCVVIFTLSMMSLCDGMTFTPGWKTSAYECECRRVEGECDESHAGC